MNIQVRTVADMVKEALRQGCSDLEQVRDKATVTITVHFQSHLVLVEAALQETFLLSAKLDQSAGLAPYQAGDRSILFDVKFPSSASVDPDLRLREFRVQLRSLGQDLWAEMAHMLMYRPEADVPLGIARRLYGLSSLLEMCDREYESLFEELNHQPGADTRHILSVLEDYYYRFTAVDYARELSLEILDGIRPLVGDLNLFTGAFDSWVATRSKKLSHIYAEYASFTDRYALMFQPEALLLFYLVESQPSLLASEWCKHYPFDELEGLATIWGVPLS